MTAISLYGLLDERSDASVHRSLSELAPVFERRRYSRLLLLGGDLNTLAIARAGSARLARDLGVLDRITRGFGLVDLLRKDLLARRPLRGPGSRRRRSHRDLVRPAVVVRQSSRLRPVAC